MKMSDYDEIENTVLKENRDDSDSGVVVADKTEYRWLYKTLKPFNSSFEEQQRVQQQVFLKTLHEMKKSTSQEIAKQQAQCQVFHEKSKEQIIQAVRTPMFASTPIGHVGSGMMGKAQYSIPSESNYPSSPRPHAASGWTPTA